MFAVNQSATKAPVADAVYPTDYNMAVASYIVGGDTGTAQKNDGNYFSKTIFKQTTTENSKSIWTGKRYWPITPATLNFFAVSEPNAENQDVVSTSFDPTNYASAAAVTLHDNQTAQHDLMYAVGRASCSAGNYPTVPMVFRHALSWINFKVATNDGGIGHITINSITLNDAIYDAKLNLGNENYALTGTLESATATITAEWDITGCIKSNNILQDATNAALTKTSTAYSAPGVLVVPGDATSFTINYTIKHEEGVENTYNYTYDISGTWLMAHKYTYVITLNLNEIKIAPSVTTWEVVADKAVTLG